MKFYFFNNYNNIYLLIFILLLLIIQNITARFVSETNHEQIDRDSQDYFHERGLTFGNPDTVYDQNDIDMENDGNQYFPPQQSLSMANIQNSNGAAQLQMEQLQKSEQIAPQIPIQSFESQLKLQQQLFQQQQEKQKQYQLQKQYARELQQPQQSRLHIPQPNNNNIFNMRQNFDKNEQNMLYKSPQKVLALLKQNEDANLLHKLPGNINYRKIYDQKLMLNQPPPIQQLQLNQARLQGQQHLILNQEPKVLVNLDNDNKQQLHTEIKENYKSNNDLNSIYSNPNSFDVEVYNPIKTDVKIQQQQQPSDLIQNNNINLAEESSFLAKNPNQQIYSIS